MAFDAFLKFPNISGESTNPSFSKWIELDSWSWGASRAAAAGPLAIQAFTFSAPVGPHSALLLRMLADGMVAKTGTTLEVVSTATGKLPAVQQKCAFSDVLLSVYDVGEVGDTRPVEQVSFTFQTLTMTTGDNTVEIGPTETG